MDGNRPTDRPPVGTHVRLYDTGDPHGSGIVLGYDGTTVFVWDPNDDRRLIVADIEHWEPDPPPSRDWQGTLR